METYLPISVQNWQAVADSHSENYPREQRTAESLRRKFQEISRRTGPTGDPTCPPYVIKAKQINRQLVQMIDASSVGSEAERSNDGLSNASDFRDEGAGEFANVINEMNNAVGNGNVGGGEVDDEEDADDAGIGVQGLVWLRTDEGQPGAVGNAGGQPRGPGRSRNLPAGAAGVAGAPPAVGVVGAPPATGVAGAPPVVGVVGAPPVAGVVGPCPLARRAPCANAARRVYAIEAPQGRAFTTTISRGRKRHGDDDNEGSMSASNIMGMMMMQQQSKQSSRDADRTAREAELALRREEISMRREEMATQMAMQREESRAHQQMMNVMLMTMMQNDGGSNHQQQRMDIGESN